MLEKQLVPTVRNLVLRKPSRFKVDVQRTEMEILTRRTAPPLPYPISRERTLITLETSHRDNPKLHVAKRFRRKIPEEAAELFGSTILVTKPESRWHTCKMLKAENLSIMLLRLRPEMSKDPIAFSTVCSRGTKSECECTVMNCEGTNLRKEMDHTGAYRGCKTLIPQNVI